MEKVKYNVAVQTYMEVFNYLIENKLFVFDSGKDFLKSRIRIGEHGFVLDTQVARGVWDEECYVEQLVPAIYVLNVLTKHIDELLTLLDIPTSPTKDYAYVNDARARLIGKKTYYSSYQKILELMKQIKLGKEQFFYSGGKVVNYDLMEYRELSKMYSRLSPLEKRTIECYARLEKELERYTSVLLLRYDNGQPVEYPGEWMFDDPNYHVASRYSEVDWNDFKDCITYNYINQDEDNKFDMRGAYSPWDRNPFISELGLDGRTK